MRSPEPNSPAAPGSVTRWTERRALPAALAQTAADVAELAAEAAAEIEPGCRPDLAAAALLAAGAAAAAAHLLSVNLSVGADDPRRSEVNKIAMRAEASAVRALGASG